MLALTLLATIAVSRIGAGHYEATAQILLQQPDQVNAVLNPDAISSAANVYREVNTNAQLITSIPVANAVRRELDLRESARELIARLSVTGEATSNLVQITARDARAERAAEVATAVAVQYQAYRRRLAQEAIGSAISAARSRLDAMDAVTRGAAEGRALERRLHQLDTAAAVTTGGVQVVRPAAVPSAPAARLTPLTVGIALALGLVLAALAVAVLERVDRRLVDQDEIEGAFELTVIARIPGQRGGVHHERRRIEAFDALAARLRVAIPPKSRRVLLVAAATPHPGDDVAIRIAEALADVEPSVLLIDADLRHQASADGSQPVAEGGLTAIVCGESTFDDEVVLATYGQAGDDPLPARAWELLPAGPGTSRATALLGRPEMKDLVAAARSRADIVIVSAPALTSGGDVLALAPLCDTILLVVREGSVTREQARSAREVLTATTPPVLGIALEHGPGSHRPGGSWTPRASRPAALPAPGSGATNGKPIDSYTVGT
jgi:capsular polysaccharide biosynthesis protein